MSPKTSRPGPKAEATPPKGPSEPSDTQIVPLAWPSTRMLPLMPLRPATGAHALDLDGPAADLNWREAVDLAVEHLARTGRAFTVDDVRGLGVGEPLRPNSWGAVVSAASKHGVIEPLAVGTSSRRERHSGLRRVWIGTPAWRDADQGREAS